jgi:hypothetical protein
VELIEERIAALDEIGFDWSSKEYATRSFDERIQDLEEYRQTHGHINVKIHEDKRLGPKEGKMQLTDERITWLDALGFE